MNERSFRFLQPLRDLLHATSLDERRCILCHIPFSPLNRGELPADADNEQRMQIPLCPSCRALLRPRKGGYCPSCGELQPFSDSEPALCETCQKTPPPWEQKIETVDLAQVRAWIHAGRKLRLYYADEQGRETTRIIWPCLIGYHERARLLIAWCETREDFRSFRADRVVDAEFLDDRYPGRPAVLRQRWFAAMEARRAAECGPQ